MTPYPFIGFSAATMLSPEGLCRSFDAGGMGYVRGEGAVAFILRRSDVAKRNGDYVYSRIAGSGVNTDGRTAGMALPSSESQAALLNEVYSAAGIDMNDVAFVEAHGPAHWSATRRKPKRWALL